MDLDYFDKEITRIQHSSSQVYLRRIELESQRQIINSQIQQTEAEMLRLDGEMRLAEKCKADFAEHNKIVAENAKAALEESERKSNAQ